MAQVAVKRISSRDDTSDYTAGADITAGDVVRIGTIPYVATQAISNGALGSLACGGVFGHLLISLRAAAVVRKRCGERRGGARNSNGCAVQRAACASAVGRDTAARRRGASASD
jgi:predicted RecA/RadA family phage recombinase